MPHMTASESITPSRSRHLLTAEVGYALLRERPVTGVSGSNGSDPKPKPSDLGILVRALRERQGLSQVKLGRAAQRSASYISMIESGERGSTPTRDTVLALADGLKATKAERDRLLMAAGMPLDRQLDGPGTEEVIAHDPRLRPEHRRILIDIYRALVAPGSKR